MVERIMTLHPEGKAGVNIERSKYDRIRKAIMDTLGGRGETAFRDLPEEVARRLAEPFDGSVSWYVTTVKLDLEARGLIERVPGKGPQHLRLSDPAQG